MIKGCSYHQNLWLFKNSHSKALSVNGFFTGRSKATAALNLSENLNHSNNTSSNVTFSSSLINEDNNKDVSLVETLLNRTKFGHTEKELQNKIAQERQLRSPTLLNLVFANRKLSFYDTHGHGDISQ